MENQRTKEDKKEVAYSNVFDNKELIVVRKADFQQSVSTLLFYSWKHRNSESHLYALYNYIQALQSLTLRHNAEPSRVVAPWPQPLFGTLEAPKGATNYPPRNDALPSNYYPDHARIMILGSKEQGFAYSLEERISIALDSSEVKVLNVETAWNFEESQLAAKKLADTHVLQVFDSSMAGLAHNPFWTSLYAFLFVGPYFSLFRWKTRPDAVHLEPLPALPIVPPPGGRQTKKKLEVLDAKRKEVSKQRIERIRKRPLPEIVYYNEPVFHFPLTKDNAWYKSPLSVKYLQALSLPTLALEDPDLECQPSWFQASDSNRFAENNRRVTVNKDTGHQSLEKAIISDPIKDELSTVDLDSDEPDPTLAGPKPPDSSDSQQSRFSETEPQVVDPNAGPHSMKTRASTQDVELEEIDIID